MQQWVIVTIALAIVVGFVTVHLLRSAKRKTGVNNDDVADGDAGGGDGGASAGGSEGGGGDGGSD